MKRYADNPWDTQRYSEILRDTKRLRADLFLAFQLRFDEFSIVFLTPKRHPSTSIHIRPQARSTERPSWSRHGCFWRLPMQPQCGSTDQASPSESSDPAWQHDPDLSLASHFTDLHSLKRLQTATHYFLIFFGAAWHQPCCQLCHQFQGHVSHASCLWQEER